MKDYQFFCDFDGTITKEDTLNKFLSLYADKEWLKVEDEWVRGKIGSKECIERQMQMFPAMDEKTIKNFVDSIEIDPTFPDFLEYLRQENIDFYIVSDGFDYFIKRILNNNNIFDVKIFSNGLKFENGKFQINFPYFISSCENGSGVCKCNVIKSNRIVTKRLLYAGDGMSDFCASKKVDILFAKGKLLEYGKNTKIDNLTEFETFEEIKSYIKAL